MARTLTKKNFEKWLAESPANALAETCSSRHCPIAQFLLENVPNAKYVSVGYNNYLVSTKETFTSVPRKQLPKWAKRFIEEVDSLGGEKIQIRACRKVLAEVA